MKVQDEMCSVRTDMTQSLQTFLQQILQQSCSVLTKQQSKTLNARLEELDNFNCSLIDLLSAVFSSLIRKVQVMNSRLGFDLVQKDYEVLQSAVQKCESQIRKHIRIEQQLKLYSDSLEEKLQSYQKVVESEKTHNTKTAELLSKIQKENKQLQQRIKILERQNENDGDVTRPKKHSKIMSEVSFQENFSSNNLRSGVQFSFDYKKRRRNMDKLNIRSKPISRQKSKADYKQFQVVIDKREERDMLKKRHSANVNQLKEKMLCVRPYKQLFDMHHTLNVSQDSDKRRQIKKRHTQVSSSTALRKQARCNSVCK